PVYLRDRLRPRYDEVAASRRTGVQDAVAAWAECAELPPHDVVVREGSPAKEIEREADAFGADLVVAGARGLNRLAEVLLGSTSRGLLRRVGCDLLVVHAREAEPPAIRRVVVATDFYDPSKAAARRAAAIAQQTGAELLALHVIDRDLWTASAYDESAVGHTQVDRAWLEKSVGEMMREFNQETMGGKAREVIRHGRPGKETGQVAADERADLVVVGTHGAGALERALLGSVAEEIVEHARAPVLVVRRTE
ncbi:MAG: universal stress protein, partial [Gemmatimonadota bacterium]